VYRLNKDTLTAIGNFLRKRREELAYSLTDVANMTGLTVNTIASLEKGKGTTLNNFLFVCRALALQPREVFADDIGLNPPYPLPPNAKKRIETTQKLDELILNTDFFTTPRRVADVLQKLESDRKESNKFSVYLTGYCKEGKLDYIKEGPIKWYVKKK